MRKSIFTARQEWPPAYARVTKARIRGENQGIFTAKTQRKIRMDPRIREGDQGSKQVIRAFMLLLGGLSVFAVKFLALVGFARKARNQLARVFAAKRSICHGITRNCTEKRGKNPFPSFSRVRKSIFTARQEWTPAYARVTKARIRRKIKAFSPRRRKGRKGKQAWTPAYARVTKARIRGENQSRKR